MHFQLLQAAHALQPLKNSTLKLAHALDAPYDQRMDPKRVMIRRPLWFVQTSSYVPKRVAGVQIMVVAETWEGRLEVDLLVNIQARGIGGTGSNKNQGVHFPVTQKNSK